MIKRTVILLGFSAGLVLALACPLAAQQSPGSVPAQTPKPTASLEERANKAFSERDYVRALPLLIRLSDQYRDDPKKLGPIQERIRVCQMSLTLNPPKELQAELNEPPVETNPLRRKAHARPADGQPVDLRIKELGNFEYDADIGGNIPEDVRKLDGAALRTRGYMIPIDQADNITEFVLVPSLFDCCFGQPPAIQHTITVRTPKGKALGYFPEEIVVEGTLQVKEEKDEGFIVSVFQMNCMSVKPAVK